MDPSDLTQPTSPKPTQAVTSASGDAPVFQPTVAPAPIAQPLPVQPTAAPVMPSVSPTLQTSPATATPATEVKSPFGVTPSVQGTNTLNSVSPVSPVVNKPVEEAIPVSPVVSAPVEPLVSTPVTAVPVQPAAMPVSEPAPVVSTTPSSQAAAVNPFTGQPLATPPASGPKA
jgi:hypothetical protein